MPQVATPLPYPALVVRFRPETPISVLNLGGEDSAGCSKQSDAILLVDKRRNHVGRLRQLEEENRRLKQIVADLSLDKAMLQAVVAKKSEGLRIAASWCLS